MTLPSADSERLIRVASRRRSPVDPAFDCRHGSQQGQFSLQAAVYACAAHDTWKWPIRPQRANSVLWSAVMGPSAGVDQTH